MKICYLNCYDPLKIHGGAERVVLQEAELLARSGNKVAVITTHNTKKWTTAVLENKESIKVWFLPSFPRVADKSIIGGFINILCSLWNPILIARIKQVLSIEQPDIVHIHNYGPMSLGIVNVAHKLGCKVIQTFHGYNFECPKGGLYRRSENVCTAPLPICSMYGQFCRETMRRYDAIVAVSSYMRERLVRAGYDPSVVSVIPNSFRTTYSPQIKRPVDKEILFVGRMLKLKGGHVLIRALAEVKKTYRERFVVNFVGNGEHRAYFETLARSSGVDVSFAGKVSDRVLEEYYQSAYLVVVPSLFLELFAIVILEAMSHGKPVIASNIGGVPEIVLHGQTGFLFEPNDVEALAKYIQILLADEELALKMGKRGLKFSEKFSESNHLKLLLNLYEKVLLQPVLTKQLQNPRCKS